MFVAVRIARYGCTDPSFPLQVYEKLLGTAAPYEVAFGLLLSPNLHRSDRYVWSMHYQVSLRHLASAARREGTLTFNDWLQNGRYFFHCFDYMDDEAAQLHGKSYARADMRVSKEDDESDYPDTELCRWHYRLCVLMRVRGYAVDMAINL